jgi:hypothetical protein
MSINKNFVVKNGFEASTDLILANADTRKVGIGTTNPQFTLDVAGGIGATDFYLTGIGTFVNELNVGLGGTVLTVLGIGNSIGIGTALPQYLLDIRSPVSTGQTALYVQGDVRITGDLSLDDVTLDDATIQDLNVTNTLIVAGLSTFNSNVFVNAALNVSGVTTLGSYVDINNSADISGALNVVGLSTLGGYVDINNSVDVGVDLNVVGLSTLGGYVDINNSVDISNNLNVVGVTTLATADINAGEIDVTRIETGNLNVTGIATIASVSIVGATLSTLTVTGTSILGVTSISQLNVSGIGTIATLNSTSGTITNITGTAGTITNLNSTSANLTNITGTAGTITNLNSTSANLTNISGTNLNYSGISTLGTVQISSGIITAISGIITYFGDGSNLTGLAGNPTLQAVLNTGNTSTIGMSISGVTTLTTLNSTSGDITNLTGTNINVSGIITASAFFGNGSGLTGVGIGSTGSINTSGIITASAFFGDGSGLTGAGSTVFNDTTTNQEFFPLFTDITTGTITASGISTSKLTYNPSSGEVTAVDFNSTSDFNLKTNIQTVDNALDIVDNLRGVSFEWKENGKKSYGVIAQELEEVLPELVKGDDPKTVSYSGIIGVLIEAVKELSEEVRELKSTK